VWTTGGEFCAEGSFRGKTRGKEITESPGDGNRMRMCWKKKRHKNKALRELVCSSTVEESFKTGKKDSGPTRFVRRESGSLGG